MVFDTQDKSEKSFIPRLRRQWARLWLTLWLLVGVGSRSSLAMAEPDVTGSFRLLTPSVTLHEPILLEFSFHNGQVQPVVLYLGFNRVGHIEFSLSRGGEVTLGRFRLTRPSGIGEIGEVRVKPGATYVQQLVLNQWYEINELGEYYIQPWFVGGIKTQAGEQLDAEQRVVGEVMAVQVTPRSAEQLHRVCQEFVRRVKEATGFREAREAIQPLSYVGDPVAVPYLQAALRERADVDVGWWVMRGLERVGNVEAVEALITYTDHEKERIRLYAIDALNELTLTLTDDALRTKIKVALTKGRPE